MEAGCLNNHLIFNIYVHFFSNHKEKLIFFSRKTIGSERESLTSEGDMLF